MSIKKEHEYLKVNCKKCKKWKAVLLCECCETFCKSCFLKHVKKCSDLNSDLGWLK